MNRTLMTKKTAAEYEKLRRIFCSNDEEAIKKAVDAIGKTAEKTLNDYYFPMAEDEDVTRQNATVVVNGPEILKPVWPGDVVYDLFDINQFGYDGNISYPKSPITPGTESDFAAFRIPGWGSMPERLINGDEVSADTYSIGSPVTWRLKHARQSAINVVGRAQEAMMNGFVQNRNSEGWHVLMTAAYGRGTAVYDTGVSAGQLSVALLTSLKRNMTSLGGGNVSSVNQYEVTDIYLSQSAIDSVYSITSTSDFAKYDMERDPITGIYNLLGLRLHPLNELGSSGAFTSYFTKNIASSALSGASKQELCIAVDKRQNMDAFKNPVRGQIRVHSWVDFRTETGGFEGRFEQNFITLDSRPILLGYI